MDNILLLILGIWGLLGIMFISFSADFILSISVNYKLALLLFLIGPIGWVIGIGIIIILTIIFIHDLIDDSDIPNKIDSIKEWFLKE